MKLLPAITRSIGRLEYTSYCEPFCGSSCLFVHLSPEKAILGDLNSELIGFYRTIRWAYKDVYKTALSYPNSKDTFYALRNIQPSQLSAIERAARFFYLNRFCFNGLYRTNKSGAFNVPYGKETGQIPQFSEFRRFANRLRKAELHCEDFERVSLKSQRNSLIYLDPPYDYIGRKDRGEYGPKAFSVIDLFRLDNLLKKLHKKGCYFLLSYLDTEEISPLASKWNTTNVDVRRQIASFSENRQTISELLIKNF